MLSSSGRSLSPGLAVQRRRYEKPGFFKRLGRSQALRGYLFISPWLFGFLVISLWPLLNTFYNSFTKYNLFNDPQWIGTKNYVDIFTRDVIFRQASLNMFWYVTAATIISICGGLMLALLLNKSFPGNHFFRTLFYVPSLLVGVAIALLFKQMYASGENGLINTFLSFFHLGPVNWLKDYDHPAVAIVALIMVNFWFIGGTMLIFIAGLKGISNTYYEAARIDGANAWYTFWRVTLPLLSPVLVFNTILTLIGHIQVFETPLIFAATQGGLATVSANASSPLGYHNNLATFLTYIYVRAFVYNDYGYASALAVVVFAITLLLTLVVLGMSNRFTYYDGQ